MVVAMVAVLGVGAGTEGASEGQAAGLIQSMAGRQTVLCYCAIVV